ncbi:MAG: protein phosphatase 2C domain-containing protein, partial [Acidobacteriota bacterium]
MLTASGRTDVGRERTGNEDAFLVDPAHGLFVVADGMGGHNAGEVASRLAVDTLAEFVRASREDSGITWPYGFVTSLGFEANQLKSALQLANQEIRFKAQRDPSYDGMGSTVVALLVRDHRGAFASVGDSRLYRWRNGQLTQLSEDDSWATSMLRAGASPEAIRQHGMRHMLTRALGTGQALDVTVSEFALADDDLFLICSDGLHGPLGDQGMAKVLAAASGDLDALTSALVDAANDAGGPD